MKFGKRLEDEAIAEWAFKYLNYKYLKKLIQKIPRIHQNLPLTLNQPLEERDNLRSIVIADEQDDVKSDRVIPLNAEEKEFLAALTSEVHKVESFFFEQLKDDQMRKDLIVQQLQKLEEIERLESSRRQSFDSAAIGGQVTTSNNYQRENLEGKEPSSSVVPPQITQNLDQPTDIPTDPLVTATDNPLTVDNLAVLQVKILKTEEQTMDIFPPELRRASNWTEGAQKKSFASEDFFIGSPRGGGSGEKSRGSSNPVPLIMQQQRGSKSSLQLAVAADDDDWNQYTTSSVKSDPLAGRHNSFLLQDTTTYPKDYEQLQLRGEKDNNRAWSSAKTYDHHRHHHHRRQRFDIRKAIFLHSSQNNFARAKKNIRKALIELFRALELLKEYRDLNIVAYSKIVKKFEKNTHHGMQETLMHELMMTPFYTSAEIDQLHQQIEDLYEANYTDGNRKQAMQALRTLGFSAIQSKANAYENLLVGFFTGLNAMLLVMIYQTAHRPLVSAEMNGLILLYFGFGFPLLIANLIIINMYTWDWYKINYRLVCGVNPRASTSQYALFVSVLFVIYLSFVSLSLNGQFDQFHPITQVWVILFLLIVIVANSFQFYRSSRVWMGILVWRIVSAPLYPCVFKDFFVADQLVSMSPFYQSVGLLLGATFSSSPYSMLATGALPFTWYIAFFPMVPFFWRAMQCLRRFKVGLQTNGGYTQLVNCSRYSLGILVLVFTTLQSAYKQEKAWIYITIAFRICYSIFSYYWDVNMDWGLGQGRINAISYDTHSTQPDDSMKTMTVYPSWVYYFVIATDGITRFVWLPFSISPLYGVTVSNITYYLGVIELLRRFQWNFIRVEIEHVHNCEKFQATETVELPFQTQDLFISASTAALSEEGRSAENQNDLYQSVWQQILSFFMTNGASMSEKIKQYLSPPSATHGLHRVSSVPHELHSHVVIRKIPPKPTRFPAWIVDPLQLIFQTKKRRTTIEMEVYAGFIQFVESLYLLALIPFQLQIVGYNQQAAVIGTCTASCVGCILSGLLTDLPFMIAPSVAVSVFFAVYVQTAGLSHEEGNPALMISGFLLALLGVLPPVDRFLTGMIPDSIQAAVSVGLGLITSLAGVTNVNIIVRGKNTLSEMGEITLEIVITYCIFIIITVLFQYRFKGAFSVCMFGGSILWWIISEVWPSSVVAPPQAIPSQRNLENDRSILLVFNLFFIFILVLNGLAKPLGELSEVNRKSGEVPRGNILFIVCGLATMLSGYLQGPPILISAESVVGIKAGGKTGLSTCVCGIFFGMAIVFYPLFAAAPACAVSAILLMIGVVMFGNINRINWEDYYAGVPAFCVMFLICFTHSVLGSVAFGYVMYLLINMYTGKLATNLLNLFQLYQTMKQRSASEMQLAEEVMNPVRPTTSDGSINNDQPEGLSTFGKAVLQVNKFLDDKFAFTQSNIDEFVQL